MCSHLKDENTRQEKRGKSHVQGQRGQIPLKFGEGREGRGAPDSGAEKTGFLFPQKTGFGVTG